MAESVLSKIERRLAMKLCPQCDTGYPDSATTCPTHGGALHEIRDLKPGMLIRKTYRIERLLGKGGMGSVYLARHELMDAQRALKFLSSDLAADEAFTRRFLREGRMLRQVRHRNVVDCGDLERAEDETLFFAMEFVDGPDLRGVLQDSGGHLNTVQALAIARGIAEGLGAAHALGMVHRDIKPENILMASDKMGWVPKIADFGIVATVETSTVYKTTRGSLLTPPYAAPEQWRGTRASELDGRTDLYALGCVLFEMLTGETVFDAENYEGWLFQHMETPPRLASSLRPELARWKGLDALVLRLLAKDREKRPRDVAEFLQLLDSISEAPPEARRVTVVEQRPPHAATVLLSDPPAPSEASAGQVERISPDLETGAESAKLKKKSRWRWEYLIFFVVAFVFFVSWYENKQKQDQAAEDQRLESAAAIQPQQQQPVNSNLPGKKTDAAALYRQAAALDQKGNQKEAAPLYDQACTGGNGNACEQLGMLYMAGSGVPQDPARARDSFSLACDAGNAEGCNNLGISYEYGGEGQQDYSRAVALFTKACNGGSAAGCLDLGSMYRDGRGVASDFDKAREFLGKSCSMGNENGCQAVKQLP
jgi:serine/threonine-protein kinase